MLGDVELEAGVAAFVFAEAASVDPELRDLVHAFELSENALSAEAGVELKMLAVPADAAKVAGDLIAAVLGVPGVRKIDPLPGGVVERGPGRVPEGGFDGGAGDRVAIPGPEFAAAMILATEQPVCVEVVAATDARLGRGEISGGCKAGGEGAEEGSSVHGIKGTFTAP